jgi:hypothetical protein
MMNTAFTVGVVLMAKDLYSGVLAKAQRDITQLGKVSQVQADAFSASLAKWQKFGAVGLGITVASAKVAGVFEDLVRTAGENETNISRAFMGMGQSAGTSREQLAGFFSEQQTRWGIMGGDVRAALGSAGGRLGDYAKGLDLVGVAATLSTARQMDMASSTDLITTLYQQFGRTLTGVTNDTDRFKVIASETSLALKAAGGDPGELAAFLENVGIKAAGAGQSLETVLGLFGVLRGSGMGTRATLGIMQLFDKMSEMRLGAPDFWKSNYPTAAKTGSVIDFLGDIKQRFADVGVTDATQQLAYLNAVFGESAPAISFLLSNMDKLGGATDRMAAAGKDLTAVERAAEDQMGTWDGVQKQLTGRVHEFKEMLGSGALPVVMSFDKAVGGMLLTLTGAPTIFKTFLAGGVGLVGLVAEAGKIAGPLMTAISALQLFMLNQNLALALQKAMTAEVGRTAVAGAVAQTESYMVGGIRFTSTAAAGARVAAGGGSLAAQSSVAAGALGMGSGGLAAAAVVAAAALGVLALGVYAAAEPGHERPAGEFVPGGETQWQYEGLKPITPGKMLTPAQQYAQSYLGPGVTPIPATGLFGTGRSVRDIATSMPKFAEGGPVGATGLALVHAGEYVLPKRTVRDLFRSGSSSSPSPLKGEGRGEGAGVYHAPGSTVVVNLALTATGHLDYDVRALAKAIIRILPGELKAQARRYA